MQAVASGISDLLRVGVCTVDAPSGSIRVTVLCGVLLVGVDNGERPKITSVADTRFCGVFVLNL